MVKRFLVGLIVVLALGAGAASLIVSYLNGRVARNEAALNQKKSDISVTIVEGKRREEIAAQLDAAGVTSYTAFLAETVNLEGTLFPDTYRFFADTPVSEVVEKMTTNYSTRLGNELPTEEELALASIVEREARNDSERAIIAGVYANRLRIGMKLDADPTVQYAKDTINYNVANKSKTFTFWSPITRADYTNVTSEYNTYRNTGIPGPICNPGLKSIQAAMNPESHGYFYFFHKDGKIFLSRTKAEHDAKLLAR